MIFRRQRKPLEEATRLLEEAVAIIRAHWRDRDYRPSAADLDAFRGLELRLANLHATARRLVVRMERRAAGELEIEHRNGTEGIND